MGSSGATCLDDPVGEQSVAVYYMGAGFFGARKGVMCDLLVLSYKNYLWTDTGPSGIEGFLLAEDKYTNDKLPQFGTLVEAKDLLILPKSCATCKRYKGDGGGTVKLKNCGGCGGIVYCGRECQAKGWKSHKKDCKARKTKIARLKEVREIFREGLPPIGKDGGAAEQIVMNDLERNYYGDELARRESVLRDYINAPPCDY